MLQLLPLPGTMMLGVAGINTTPARHRVSATVQQLRHPTEVHQGRTTESQEPATVLHVISFSREATSLACHHCGAPSLLPHTTALRPHALTHPPGLLRRLHTGRALLGLPPLWRRCTSDHSCLHITGDLGPSPHTSIQPYRCPAGNFMPPSPPVLLHCSSGPKLVPEDGCRQRCQHVPPRPLHQQQLLRGGEVGEAQQVVAQLNHAQGRAEAPACSRARGASSWVVQQLLPGCLPAVLVAIRWRDVHGCVDDAEVTAWQRGER